MNSEKRKKINPTNTGKKLVIVGVLLVVVIIIIVKYYKSNVPTDPNQVAPAKEVVNNLLPPGTPEEQMDWSIRNNQAAFVFFHSTDCQSCIDMMDIVDKVYPEFQDKVVLIDVNVYDETNQNLLRRGGVKTIPTQLFLDSNGQGKITLGVMSQDQLREQLAVIAGDAQ